MRPNCKLASDHQRTAEYLASKVVTSAPTRDWYPFSDDAAVGIEISTDWAQGVSLVCDDTVLLSTGGGFSSLVSDADWAHFQHLASEWRIERGITSSITQIAMCPSYQRIIAMGQSAIPLILRQLEIEGDDPDHWFWALRSLTGVDPVLAEDRGNMGRMAVAWLHWWQRDQYAW